MLMHIRDVSWERPFLEVPFKVIFLFPEKHNHKIWGKTSFVIYVRDNARRGVISGING